MSSSSALSHSGFKALALDAGGWVWGTLQGCFNEKASIAQMITDAIIGMIPVVGDVTAVRDLIAVSIGLVEDPKKRESTWEWALLVVLLFALIPVFGGIAKGIGRLTIDAAKSGRASAKVAMEMVEFLNRVGHGHAEKWLLKFRFAEHEAMILEKLSNFTDTVINTIRRIKEKFTKTLPRRLLDRLDQLQKGFVWLNEQGSKHIPGAIKELDHKLREIQAYVHSGGTTTSRKTMHQLSTGEHAVTHTDEARLLEDGPLPARSTRNGWAQNPASTDPKELKIIKKYYKHEPGYPDLMAYTDLDAKRFNDLAAYSGKIINRPLKPGEKVFRFFGPEGVTHGFEVRSSNPAGAWWGLGEAPKSAAQWRKDAAVLDEFNRDGFIVTGTVPAGADIKACVGVVSEQFGKNIPGQYLAGGAHQAVIHWDATLKAKIIAAGNEVMKTQKAVKVVDPHTGMIFEVAATGWKDSNGVHGYFHLPGPGAVQTAKLGARERASKEHENKPK